jgi:hypothetical protein
VSPHCPKLKINQNYEVGYQGKPSSEGFGIQEKLRHFHSLFEYINLMLLYVSSLPLNLGYLNNFSVPVGKKD